MILFFPEWRLMECVNEAHVNARESRPERLPPVIPPRPH